jgi:hypothetical protein
MIKITQEEKIQVLDLWGEIDDEIANLKLWVRIAQGRCKSEAKRLLSQVYNRLVDIDEVMDILGKLIRRLGYDAQGRLRIEEESTMNHYHINAGLPGCLPDYSAIAKSLKQAKEIAMDYIQDEIEHIAMIETDIAKLDEYENIMKENIEKDKFTFILPDETRYLEIVACDMVWCLAEVEA